MTSWKEYVKNIASYNLSSKISSSVSDWAEIGFKIKAVEENKTIYSTDLLGTVENENNEDFLTLLNNLNKDFHLVESTCKGHRIKSFKSIVNKNKDYTEYHVKDMLLFSDGLDFETGKSNFRKVYISDDAIVEISSCGKNEFRINIQTFEEEKLANIAEKFNHILKKKKDRRGRVCTLLMDRSSLYVSDLGPAGVPLVRENYSKEVLEGYDFLVKDLSSENPRGRLAILDGEPGTGKSYMIKSLINDISNVIFLIVPSTLVSRISDPSFMPAIIDLHEEEQVPIIMLLEDADATLLPRGTDNMGSISDLLNFADGIIGKIVDFRIVATTNAKKIEIEPALMRKGRLSKHIHVGKLEKEHADMIFKRLTGFPGSAISNKEEITKLFNKPTLAELYDIAYNFLEKQTNEKANQ